MSSSDNKVSVYIMYTYISAQSRLCRRKDTTEVGNTIYSIVNNTKIIFTYNVEMMRPP